ncbi:MAG: multicopper oxidase domain-containing protein [Nostoc sp.]|uniref:multicopper oxidase family protein n=1 Tax=Nostoc sp. TaxID=1180 RepID=UPI002FF4E42C
MKRLSQFLYKLLLTILAGIFISISTFPAKVIAFDLRNTPPQYREQARQQEAQLRKPRLGAPRPGAPQLGEAPPQPRNCPNTNQPIDFQKNLGLDYLDSNSNHVLNATLNVINPESFTLGDVTFKSSYQATYDGNTAKFKTDSNNQRIALYQTEDDKPGTYIPPVLRVSPGDTINLKLNNKLTGQWTGSAPQDTNFHYHGFNVPATENADDVLTHIRPGQSDPMGFVIPENHQPGLFWYHPHVHDDSDSQVSSGMSGAIIIKGIEKYYPIINGIPLKPDKPNLVKEIVKDIEQPYDTTIKGILPQLKSSLTERVLLFKDLQLKEQLETDPPNSYACYTLNGLVNPNITIRPGEVQFWRIGNIGADNYINLSLQKSTDDTDDTSPFYILARDGNIVNSPFLQKEPILLAPGNRVEVLVIGPPSGQKYNLVSTEVFNEDTIGQPHSAATFPGNPTVATVSSEGEQVNYDVGALEEYILSQKPQDKLDDLPSIEQLAKKSIPETHKRTFTFTQNFTNPNKLDRGGEFYINDNIYDENQFDTIVRLGDIEEWTLVNATPIHHAFHIHQLDFLVTEVNGKSQLTSNYAQGYQDVIDLPPCGKAQDNNDSCDPTTVSKTVVRIPFTNKIIAAKFDGNQDYNLDTDNSIYKNGEFVGGKFVYHCHLLYHEDHGMMQNILVLPPLPVPFLPPE